MKDTLLNADGLIHCQALIYALSYERTLLETVYLDGPIQPLTPLVLVAEQDIDKASPSSTGVRKKVIPARSTQELTSSNLFVEIKELKSGLESSLANIKESLLSERKGSIEVSVACAVQQEVTKLRKSFYFEIMAIDTRRSLTRVRSLEEVRY